MAEQLIEAAARQKELAEQRLRELEEQLARVQQEAADAAKEVTDWQTFLDRALELTSGQMANGKPQPGTSDANQSLFDAGPPKRLRIKRDSWAGYSARLILDKGPLTQRELRDALAEKAEAAEVKEFRTTLSSALGRRPDVFQRDEAGRFHLRSAEVDFVD